jgi:hypothetical protein
MAKRCSNKTTFFGSLVSPSQEAFTMLISRMGSRSGHGCTMDQCHLRQLKPAAVTHQMALLVISTKQGK